MKLRRDPLLALPHCLQIAALLPDPIGVVMSFLPIVAWSVAEFPKREPVIKSWLGTMPGALQMEFAYHSAIITGVRNQLADNRRMIRKRLVAITRIVNTRRVKTGHET